MAESESNASRPTPLGIYDRPQTETITGIEIAAIAATVIWLIGSAILLLTAPDAPPDSPFDPLRIMITAMAIFLPVAMIWVAAMTTRSSRIMREESLRLQATIDVLRQAYIAQNQSGKGSESSVTRKLDEIAATTRKTETAIATFTSSRSQPAPTGQAPTVTNDPVTSDDQPRLALGTTAADHAPPLAAEDFIRALNFPETADDMEGFAALRRALRDRTTAQLVQAAQDILTLLSQEGIYMDDLPPDRARPEIWRTFAQGARGKSISSLGGIRDQSSLALCAGRMKQDPIFRDVAHHFLRKFDHTFADFEPKATDAEISALANTRTARAFMLLGRVAGTFD